MGARFEALIEVSFSWHPWILGTLMLDSILSLFKCERPMPHKGSPSQLQKAHFSGEGRSGKVRMEKVEKPAVPGGDLTCNLSFGF